MSINVTVHGNPISIKKGKMVTHDADSEFDRRRRIRLQQVREQSKEIAADVRNRVRKEKEKQLSKAEQKGEQDLKRWKARKLLVLQQQYEDCLKEVGSAHNKAVLEPDPDEILHELAAMNQAEADTRSKVATEKKKYEDTQKRLELEKSNNLKKNVRKYEDARSAMVSLIQKESNKKKKKKRKKVSTDVTITNNIVNESDTSENFISDGENIPEKIVSEKGKTKQKVYKESPKQTKNKRKPEHSATTDSSFGLSSPPSDWNDTIGTLSPRSILSPNTTPALSPKKNKHNKYKDHNLTELSANTTPALSPQKNKNNKYKDHVLTPLSANTTPALSPQKNKNNKFKDHVLTAKTSPPSPPRKLKDHLKISTKISDKILQRKVIDEESSCECPQRKQKLPEDINKECICEFCSREHKNLKRKLPDPVDKESICKCYSIIENNLNCIHNIEKPEQIRSRKYKPNLQIESYKICEIQAEGNQNIEPKSNLPYVPTTTLHSDAFRNISSACTPSTCKYYDHLNHFSKEYNAQPVVQKISKQSIQVLPPSDRSESSEILKTIQARDKIAHDRGIRAMEKEKVHKDYKQLLDELPVLQKQERLASMRTHNPAFHMPEDRIQELEQRRQSRIENIFDKYYQKLKILETPLVTLRPIQKTPPAEEMKLPFRALDVTESLADISVGKWKSEHKHSDSEIGTQDQEDDLENRQKALANLLQRVNKQRELLLQEVSTLPSSSNLQKILQDEEILKLIYPDKSQEPSKNIQKEKQGPSKKKLKEKHEPSKKLQKEKREPSKKLHKEETETSPLSVKSPSKPNAEKQTNKRGPVASSCSCSDSSSEEIKKKKHKKVKHKKQRILIKNEGTQTSPLVNNTKSSLPKTTSDTQEPEKCICICKPTTNIPDKCNCGKLCKKDAKSLCEIIIKMNDQTDLNVCKKHDEQSPSKQMILSISKPTKISIRSPTNGNDVSSSTTYMSLPDGAAKQKTTKPSSASQQRQQYKDLLHHKPQQTNIDRTDNSTDPNQKEITPTLLRYIQKLLSMSRQSIDELTVSSISDVSTPGTSIVDTVENTAPFVQLQNVMQYYNLSFNDIQRHLASSSGSKSSEMRSETVQQRTVYVRTSPADGVIASKEQEAAGVELEKSSSSSSAESIKSPQDHADVAKLVEEKFDLKPEDMEEVPYANILAKYNDLTKTCCDRITKLTEMIDNVRIEKERLLSPAASDKYETSLTSYLELPKTTNDSTRVDSNDNKSGRHSNGTSSSSSLSQDAVDRYLLDVSSQQCSPTCSGKQNYKANQDVNELPVSDNNCNKNDNSENFVPMLQGIPRYTEPTESKAMNFLNSPVKQFLLSTKTKPPPSLLRNSNKYNLNIDMTPHELSTIVELDTVVSSRNVSAVVLPRPLSPEEKVPSRDEAVPEKSEKDDASGFVTLTPLEEKNQSCSSECLKRSSDEAKKSEPVPRKSSLKKSSRCTSPCQGRSESNTELSGIQPINSDGSTSSPEDMATILRNMGLGWAVSTLKKTHEAFALSSSSSSVETSFRRRVSFKNSSNSNSNSDVSLKDVLSKELMKRISSSTLLTDSSPISPNLQDIDISEIRDPTNLNKDGSQHRTSTPVHHSKSTDSKKDLFTGDSDISSVRLQTEDFFLSIPNVSLDTNKSLSKSKE